MSKFVWTKMHAEGGQPLDTILLLKEAERLTGNGTFWWGVGNAPPKDFDKFIAEAGGTLPVVFSKLKGLADKKDAEPETVFLWTEWVDGNGDTQPIPPHVLEWSRGSPGKTKHYALVCYSSTPLAIGPQAFDRNQFRTHLGNRLADQQVTTLAEGDLGADHSHGVHRFGFRATLVREGWVKLINSRPVCPKDIGAWTMPRDWQAFVDRIREHRKPTLGLRRAQGSRRAAKGRPAKRARP